MRVSGSFTNSERMERQAPPPHPSPLKGEGVGGGVGLATADHRDSKAEWVRENLPICSSVAAAFRGVFCDVRMTFASERGHSIGKPSSSEGFSVTGDALLAHQVMARKVAK